MTQFNFDIIIIGGGIAGLWTLAELRERGYNAILFEKEALGAGQSMASQGIIHGGSKYALSGVISPAANNISQMPARWQHALANQGAVKLADVATLSSSQFLIPASGIDGKLLSFLGSKSMASFTQKIKVRDLPAPYQQLNLKGHCFQLNEMVLDTASLFRSFLQQYGDYIYQSAIEAAQITVNADDASIQFANFSVHSKRLIYAAGHGNAQLPQSPRMQTRPLQMLMLKATQLPLIYAHFIGRSSKPLLTITSHRCDDGVVWYLGGNLAEEGVQQSEEELIHSAKKLLHRILPHFTLSEQAQFKAFSVSRAEPKQSSLLRPDDAFIKRQGAVISGWPTKLALAPRFAEQVVQELSDLPASQEISAALPLAHPEVASLPWQ